MSSCKIFLIYIFSNFFCTAITAQLPNCKDTVPANLLNNASFEQHSTCDTAYEGGLLDYTNLPYNVTVSNWSYPFLDTFSQAQQAPRYYNLSCRMNSNSSIFDTANGIGDRPTIPLPLPDGNGVMELLYAGSQRYDESRTFKTYVCSCPSNNLIAGQSYILTFYLGFGKATPQSLQLNYISHSPFNIALFGRSDCKLPSPDPEASIQPPIYGCMADHINWLRLGNVQLSGNNEWVQGKIEFTPSENISAIGIGADCNYDQALFDSSGFYYLDNLVLASKEDFAFKNITLLSGNACDGNYILSAPYYDNAKYQWYKDGVLLNNATDENFSVPNDDNAKGNYVVNISLPSVCFNSLPYTVNFSTIKKFSFGNDTTACAPAQVKLDATWPGVTNYLWQDGSNKPTFIATQTGLYSVTLSDEAGCVKTFSKNVVIQTCTNCKIFFASAFTPNNDGLNDVFRASASCANINFEYYHLSVFNRFGEKVFESSDFRKGWDGNFKNQLSQQAVYVYFVDYKLPQANAVRLTGTITLIR